MSRLLSGPDLDQYRAFVTGLAGTGTGVVPQDLGLLLGHVEAQAAELRRERARIHALIDATRGLIDYAEHGGDDGYRDKVIAEALAAARE